MKIQEGCIIKNKKIEKSTDSDFFANYKGKFIEITTSHKHGKAEHDHLKRFDIVVRDKSGSLDVNTYEDFHTIREAIRYALKGACLIENTKYTGEKRLDI